MNIFNQQLVHVHLLLQIKEIQDQVKEAKQQFQQCCQNQIIDSKAKRYFWTAREDELLLAKIQEIGIENYKQIKLESKSDKQVYYRLRYLKHASLTEKELTSSRIDLNCFQKFPTNYK
ncbi:SANT/Myb_domain [Hexamita inflata]|uniref:SANT/Myb domain n=1 Tax=Hexamita inflata TaxID=28002 RepID=A0AA86UVC3_9EUKA|nr:SANT/Myb domain [Hexamita inflata]